MSAPNLSPDFILKLITEFMLLVPPEERSARGREVRLKMIEIGHATVQDLHNAGVEKTMDLIEWMFEQDPEFQMPSHRRLEGLVATLEARIDALRHMQEKIQDTVEEKVTLAAVHQDPDAGPGLRIIDLISMVTQNEMPVDSKVIFMGKDGTLHLVQSMAIGGYQDVTPVAQGKKPDAVDLSKALFLR
jgi:hypothetical protein